MARPREFDIDEALDAAIRTFWTYGYEATSVNDLLESMGLQKGSMYKAFGDKRSLFIASLRRYLRKLSLGIRHEFSALDSPTAKIETWLSLARTFGRDRRTNLQKGCMAVNVLIEMGPHDTEVQAELEEYFRGVERYMAEVIREGQASGEFRQDVSSERLTRYLIEYVMGILTVSRGPLQFVSDEDHVDLAMRGLKP